MFAIEVELLTGRYVATRHDDRERGEWPPHPARLVYALVAAAGAERTADEADALVWLCDQPPPEIACTPARQREIVTTYVPVNDRATADSAAAGTLPRPRQPRTFPAMVPEESTVTYVWPDADPNERIRSTLASLASEVVYVGHSSSLTRAAVVEIAPRPALVPGRGEQLLRVPANGLLHALDEALARHEATAVRGPLPADYSRYGAPEAVEPPPPPLSVFGEMIVLRRSGGPRLPIAASEQVAARLRAAVLKLVPDPVPHTISGHGPQGAPLDRPHVAYLALPDVGHPHATGSLLGVALALPRDLAERESRLLLAALGTLSTLRISRSIAWTLEPVRADSSQQPARALRSGTWTSGARRYATATPIELDKFVTDRYGDEAVALVAASAEHVGLPRPARISLSPVSALTGAGHVRDLRSLRDRPRRPIVHAVLEFAEDVQGPILLGAGRYRGLGLCRPLHKA